MTEISDEVQHWCAGWNRAGYGVESPESVMHGGSIAEAFEHVQSALEFERDQLFDGPEKEAFTDAIDEWSQVDQREVEVQAGMSRLYTGISVVVDGWEYWVMPCFTVGCDQVNDEE